MAMRLGEGPTSRGHEPGSLNGAFKFALTHPDAAREILRLPGLGTPEERSALRASLGNGSVTEFLQGQANYERSLRLHVQKVTPSFRR